MDILVTASGFLSWPSGRGASKTVRCALGRGGVGQKASEGDGLTPLGRFPLRRLFFRADRLHTPTTALVTVTIEKNHGWCDDPASAAYNTLISLPDPTSHEAMWRQDGLYDVVIETGYNDDPVIPGKGSAIFIHIARPEYAPTEGCVALDRGDLLEMLRDCDGEDFLVVSLR